MRKTGSPSKKAAVSGAPRRGSNRRGRRVPGQTRISAKNQATIPASALRESGLRPGDRLRVEGAGSGRVVLALVRDPESRLKLLDRYRGCMPPGTYPPDYLEKLRAEWERPWD